MFLGYLFIGHLFFSHLFLVVSAADFCEARRGLAIASDNHRIGTCRLANFFIGRFHFMRRHTQSMIRQTLRLLFTGMVIGGLLVQPLHAGCWMRGCAPSACYDYCPPACEPVCSPCYVVSACSPVNESAGSCGCSGEVVSGSPMMNETIISERVIESGNSVDNPVVSNPKPETSVVNKPDLGSEDPAPTLSTDDAILPSDTTPIPADDKVAMPEVGGDLDPMPTDDIAEEPADTGLFGGGGAEEVMPAEDSGIFGGAEEEVMPAEDAAMPTDESTDPPVDAPVDDGGLFGGATEEAAPADDGGLFGGGAEEEPMPTDEPADAPLSDGGLFGGGEEETMPAEDGGLFGDGEDEAMPADEPADDGGLFGGSEEQAIPADDSASADDGGLFGGDSAPADSGGSLFDEETKEAAPADGGLFDSAPAADAPADATEGGGLFDFSQVLGEPGGMSSSEFRTWTDNTGLHECQGRLLSTSEGFAKLLKDNGRTSTVAFNRLSDADISFVNRQVDASSKSLIEQTAQR